MPQSPDGVHIVFLLCSGTITLKILNFITVKRFTSSKSGLDLVWNFEFFFKNIKSSAACYAAKPAIETSDIPSEEMLSFPKIHYFASMK